MPGFDADAGFAFSQKNGAIAYSPYYRRWGSSWGWGSRSDAEQAALNNLARNDGRVLMWACNAYLALALADSGAYGSGWGFSQRAAEKDALRSCRQHDNDAHIVLCFHAGG